MKHILEIRSLTLKPGTRAEFLKRYEQTVRPLLERWAMDVVAYGPSLEREDGAYVIRAYDSLEHRQQSQAAFYGSAEWREGPRKAILACIESYVDTVLELNQETLELLRRQ